MLRTVFWKSTKDRGRATGRTLGKAGSQAHHGGHPTRALMAVAMLFLLTLVPSSAACPQAILLRAEHDRTSVLLSWDILPGSVDADAWVVEKSVDGLEPEGIVLAGTATGYADETNDAAFGTAYAVYYLLDGRRSQPSNSVIVLVYPRCDVISGPNVHPDCLFPLPP